MSKIYNDQHCFPVYKMFVAKACSNMDQKIHAGGSDNTRNGVGNSA